MGATMERPRHQATDRGRIPEKIRECNFFLDLMERSEKEARIKEEFLFFFSAFLCAFRTVEYRAKGVLEKAEGKSRADEFWNNLQDDREMAFVKNLAGFEIHGDGIRVYESMPLGHDPESISLFPPTLVQRCRTALEKLENTIRQIPQLL